MKVPAAGISNKPSDDVQFSDDDFDDADDLQMMNEQDNLANQLSRKRPNVDQQSKFRQVCQEPSKVQRVQVESSNACWRKASNSTESNESNNSNKSNDSNKSNSSYKLGLIRQNAINTNYQFSENYLNRINNCRDFEELAFVMQERLEKFQTPRHLPHTWLGKFETFVQNTCATADLETRLYGLLPFFKDEESASTWFFEERRKANRPWNVFKTDVVNNFLTEYWTSMRLVLSNMKKPDFLHDFLDKKIKERQLLFREMHSSSIIRHCCASVPIDIALELQEVIDMSIPMFLTRTKAIDRRNGTESAQEHSSVQAAKVTEMNATQNNDFQQLFQKSLEDMLASKNFFDSISTVVKQSLNTSQTLSVPPAHIQLTNRPEHDRSLNGSFNVNSHESSHHWSSLNM